MGEDIARKLQDITNEMRACLSSERKFVMLTLAEKLTVLCSFIVILAVILLLGAQLVLYLMFSLAEYVGAEVDSLAIGYVVSAGVTLLLILLFYVMRTRWVINPIARFMTHLFNSTEP